jgi:dihydroxyacetone kinase
MIQDKNNVEILVIIKNYTGDLINFESAVEMVRNQYKEKNV